jgi:NAD(P)H-dependent FMN reductase
MKYIIASTNRPQSRSLKLSQIVQGLFKELGEEVEIIDLAQVPLKELLDHPYNPKAFSPAMQSLIQKINSSEALYFVVPEYNGSLPGALKLFIDHWAYPETFEHRPVAFMGIGGMFGGLRPVEHLQHIMGYRNAFCYPDRIFIQNVWTQLEGDQLKDQAVVSLLKAQVKGFQLFCQALASVKLDANHLNASRAPRA